MGCISSSNETASEGPVTHQKKSRILAFGKNLYGELSWTLDEEYNDLDIKFVRAGKGFYIFGNHETQRYYDSGSNRYGGLNADEASIDDKMYEIDYFRDHHIKIRQVYTNQDSSSVFWFTEANNVYKTGTNGASGHQLAFDVYNVTRLQPVPVLLHGLRNVLDIKSNEYGSIALCSVDAYSLINGYFRNDDHCELNRVAEDILALIRNYFGASTRIFTNQPSSTDDNIASWNQNEHFFDRNIIKITCSMDKFFYLDSNGIIYENNDVCGIPNEPKPKYSISGSYDDAKGITFDTTIMKISRNEQYEEREKIYVDIASGFKYFWAIDGNGNIREWSDCSNLVDSDQKLFKINNHDTTEYDRCIRIGPGRYAKTEHGMQWVWIHHAFPRYISGFDPHLRFPEMLRDHEIEDIAVSTDSKSSLEQDIVVIFKEVVDATVMVDNDNHGPIYLM